MSVRTALINAASDFLTGAETISSNLGTLIAQPTIAADCIAWENRVFSTAGKSLWASVFYLPNPQTGRTIGQGGIDEKTGILQIDLNSTVGDGEAIFIGWENKAQAYWHIGRAFGAQSVLVRAFNMGDGRKVENNWRRTVSITFRANLKRHHIT